MDLKSKNKLKSQSVPIERTRLKTKADLWRRLKKRRAFERLTAEKKRTEAADEMKRALMIWVDDGGRTA